MSEAKASNKDIFNYNVCSQCLHEHSRSQSRDFRHAVPCGHVFCKDCVGRVEAEQKSGKSICRKPTCNRELASASEFAVSWVSERAERIRIEHAALFGDQGDVGSSTTAVAATGGDPAPSLCAKHCLPFRAVLASSHIPICSECMTAVDADVALQTFDEAMAALDSTNASTSAEVAKQVAALAEPTFTPDEFCDNVASWGAQETARIRAWEEREVKHVQAVAEEIVQLVQEVCARRIEIGASMITQRTGLRASLEELNRALIDLPTEPATRLTRMQVVYAERKRLSELLAGSQIDVPSAARLRWWAQLPNLSPLFDRTVAGSLASSILDAAKSSLDWALMHFGSCRQFPVLPRLDRAKGLRKIPMGGKPNVFVGIDENTIVVGFNGEASLQVWDLAAGNLLRESEPRGQYCFSMANLPGGRVAAGWSSAGRQVVSVVDVNTRQQIQQLSGFGDYVRGLVFFENTLLTMCSDRALRVWTQDSAGMFTEMANFATTGIPYGMLTVLSDSAVAVSTYNPVQIEIWDWTQGKQIRTLSGFQTYVFGTALLPDGRLVAGDFAGVIRVGFVDMWNSATSTSNQGSGIIGVLAGNDGSFVTTDLGGNINLWRDGVREVTLNGACREHFYGVPMAVVGRRLVLVGRASELLVGE